MNIQQLQSIYRISNDDLAYLLKNWTIKDEDMQNLIDAYSEVVITRMKKEVLLNNVKTILRGLE